MYKRDFNAKEGAEGVTATETEHALVIRGRAVSVHLLSTFADFAQDEYGYTVMDLGVATCLDAIAVFTSLKGSQAMRAAIDEANKDLPQPARWFAGYDTGNSSLTIADCFCNIPGGSMDLNKSLPRDADDFGRCVRLLDAMPKWRARLSHVAKTSPEWEPLINEWEQLERMYRNGHLDQVSTFLRELSNTTQVVS